MPAAEATRVRTSGWQPQDTGVRGTSATFGRPRSPTLSTAEEAGSGGGGSAGPGAGRDPWPHPAASQPQHQLDSGHQPPLPPATRLGAAWP